MSTAIDAFVHLDTTSCCVCGVVFAMPVDLLRRHREQGSSFYCPNGHSLSYAKSEVQRLRDQLDRASARTKHLEDQREASERSNSALRGVITKQRQRAAAGVCPCCHRTFQQLARHMGNKHPDYADGGVS